MRGAVTAPHSLRAAPPPQLLLHASPTSQHAFAVVREGVGEHKRRIRVFFGPRHGSRKLMDRSIQPLDYWIAPIQRGPISPPIQLVFA